MNDPEPHLPRSRAGSSPQHLLVTLLGDYWAPRVERLPSAALVALLAEFEIGPTAARAAVNRLARRGVLVPSRVGRTTHYGFAPGAADMLLAGAYRFVSFGASDEDWDGRWTLALFSLNSSERDLRYAVRSRLRWLGFAPLYDGVWVSARPVAVQVRRELDALGVRDVTVLRADEPLPSGRRPLQAWDLDAIAATYTSFVETYEPVRDQVRDGAVSSGQALLTRTRIMDSWRSFPGLDPDLPARLLHREWPRGQAREIFVEVYDALGPLAALRVRQIVERHGPELAGLIQPHTTRLLLELGRQAGERRARSERVSAVG